MSSNHSSAIKQFHRSVENFSHMFVAELAVLSSVKILFDTIWKVCSFTCILKEHSTGVVSSVLMSVCAQEEHCI